MNYQEVMLDIQLKNFLTYNCYPPVSLDYINVCKQAITYARNDEDGAIVEMPDGEPVRVYEVMERFHLDCFIDYP